MIFWFYFQRNWVMHWSCLDRVSTSDTNTGLRPWNSSLGFFSTQTDLKLFRSFCLTWWLNIINNYVIFVVTNPVFSFVLFLDRSRSEWICPTSCQTWLLSEIGCIVGCHRRGHVGILTEAARIEVKEILNTRNGRKLNDWFMLTLGNSKFEWIARHKLRKIQFLIVLYFVPHITMHIIAKMFFRFVTIL